MIKNIAKDRKIVAKQIGKIWFISEKSLLNYKKFSLKKGQENKESQYFNSSDISNVRENKISIHNTVLFILVSVFVFFGSIFFSSTRAMSLSNQIGVNIASIIFSITESSDNISNYYSKQFIKYTGLLAENSESIGNKMSDYFSLGYEYIIDSVINNSNTASLIMGAIVVDLFDIEQINKNTNDLSESKVKVADEIDFIKPVFE